jgi:hypothetical protein
LRRNRRKATVLEANGGFCRPNVGSVKLGSIKRADDPALEAYLGHATAAQ